MEEQQALELLLNFAKPGARGVKRLAGSLKRRYSSFQGVLDAPYDELLAVEGVGADCARLIKLVRRSVSLYMEQDLAKRRKISNTCSLIDFCRAELAGNRDESFLSIFLNSQNEVLNFEVIEEGTADQCVVYPRKVLERALRNKASAMIFVHNHPGGSCKPSREDIVLTEVLSQGAQVLDICVHDHIIISRNSYFSFRERGLLRPLRGTSIPFK
ncbi:MAG: hypothetical protein Kow0025_12680 [Thermodesulfovibrionales bacterium]